MQTQTKDWRLTLQTWLQHHPKTMPDHLRQLRENFVQHFPPEDLKEMTLDQYAIGKPDSFCYWLEFKTKELVQPSGNTAGGCDRMKGQQEEGEFPHAQSTSKCPSRESPPT